MLSLGVNLIFKSQIVKLNVIIKVNRQDINILFGATRILAPVQNSVYLFLIADTGVIIFSALPISKIMLLLPGAYNNFFKIFVGVAAALQYMRLAYLGEQSLQQLIGVFENINLRETAPEHVCYIYIMYKTVVKTRWGYLNKGQQPIKMIYSNIIYLNFLEAICSERY